MDGARASPSTSRVLRASVRRRRRGSFTLVVGFFTARFLLSSQTKMSRACSLRDGPYACTVDRAIGSVPPPQAQKHHEKAVARAVDRGIHGRRQATLELVVLRLARGVRALGAFFGKRRFEHFSPRPSVRRHAARRGWRSRSPRRRARSPRSRRAGAASSCCRRRCARSARRHCSPYSAASAMSGRVHRCSCRCAARRCAATRRPRRPPALAGDLAGRRRRAAGDACCSSAARPRRGEGDAPRRLGPRGAAALARRPPRSESDARARQSHGRRRPRAAVASLSAGAPSTRRRVARRTPSPARRRGCRRAGAGGGVDAGDPAAPGRGAATSLRCARRSRRRANGSTQRASRGSAASPRAAASPAAAAPRR